MEKAQLDVLIGLFEMFLEEHSDAFELLTLYTPEGVLEAIKKVRKELYG